MTTPREPLLTRPPPDLLAKHWEELTPDDHARLDAYLAHLIGVVLDPSTLPEEEP